jgi:hypothetical protein
MIESNRETHRGKGHKKATTYEAFRRGRQQRIFSRLLGLPPLMEILKGEK